MAIDQMKATLGYMDESGTTGIAINNCDFFVICIVLFKSRDEAKKLSDKINTFRAKNHLSDTYELHYVENHKRIRSSFIEYLSHLSFTFISISIRKNNSKHYTSYSKMAKLILEALDNNLSNVTIEMDKNPKLYAELRKTKNNYQEL